jgi:hypothetical protein
MNEDSFYVIKYKMNSDKIYHEIVREEDLQDTIDNIKEYNTFVGVDKYDEDRDNGECVILMWGDDLYFMESLREAIHEVSFEYGEIGMIIVSKDENYEYK